MIYCFAVPGHPVGKGPARAAMSDRHGQPLPRPRHYTAGHIRRYIDLVVLCFRQLYTPVDDRDHDWRLDLEIYHKGRCDMDKVFNSIMDALQAPKSRNGIPTRGMLWHNDCQIARSRQERHRVADERDEKVIIRAEMLKEKV